MGMTNNYDKAKSFCTHLYGKCLEMYIELHHFSSACLIVVNDVPALFSKRIAIYARQVKSLTQAHAHAQG